MLKDEPYFMAAPPKGPDAEAGHTAPKAQPR